LSKTEATACLLGGRDDVVYLRREGGTWHSKVHVETCR